MRFTVQWSSAEGEAEAGGSERAVKSEKSAKNCEIFASKDRRYLTGSASERASERATGRAAREFSRRACLAACLLPGRVCSVSRGGEEKVRNDEGRRGCVLRKFSVQGQFLIAKRRNFWPTFSSGLTNPSATTILGFTS